MQRWRRLWIGVVCSAGCGRFGFDPSFAVGDDATVVDAVASVCPANYALVPPLPPYTQVAFCVSKFEMKILGQANGVQAYDSSLVPDSRPDGIPWTGVPKLGAVLECQSLGAGFDLISNDQWQTIARHAELEPRNWTSGVVGVEMMYRGYTNGGGAGYSVSDEADWYDQTGANSGQLPGVGKEQRRTLILSNDEVIWDLAGNKFEWVKDDLPASYGVTGFHSLISDSTNPTTIGGRTVKQQYGPAGDYSGLAASEYGGLGACNCSSMGAMMRGGWAQGDFYFNGPGGGVFEVDNTFTDGSGFHICQGFRCVMVP